MEPSDRDGSERIHEPSEGSSEAQPRVFVWGQLPEERSIFQRIADRFRSAPPARDEAPPAVRRPVVGRRAAIDDERPVREAPPPPLPAVDGWDPPDLTVEEPVKPEAAPEPRPAAPSDDDHGPGPIYRATLQLLPGRLRPLDPDIVREEIRFVRPTGGRAAVTLGWAEGEPPDHITVNHPSVQDRHARMSFVDRRWYIESLVAPHPVRVNEESVPAGADPRELQSGDEVRLGDASFHFLMP
ncbi:FHA domain-containing protein [Gaopeijia maritima]|uniref:FHA domain-containing protein n=1 Tax=Gaopeijia maritima TaxID=3119007 RepID=A0ABU9E9H5_9BACT